MYKNKCNSQFTNDESYYCFSFHNSVSGFHQSTFDKCEINALILISCLVFLCGPNKKLTSVKVVLSPKLTLFLRELRPPESEAILEIEEIEETLLTLLKLLLLDFRRRGRLKQKDDLQVYPKKQEILGDDEISQFIECVSLENISIMYLQRQMIGSQSHHE